MKRSQEIIGLPVIAVLDGKKVGQIRDLVINPQEGKVEFVLVSTRNLHEGAKVMPFVNILGLGEHAMTIERETSLTMVDQTPDPNQLLGQNIQLTGTSIFTNRGNLVGVTKEYIIDEDNGEIICLEYKLSGSGAFSPEAIKAQDVLAYGADVIVIKHTAEYVPENKVIEPLAAAEPVAPPTPEPMPAPITLLSSTMPQADTSESQPSDSRPADGASFFKQRQRQFLLGKKLVQDIRDAQGNILFSSGTVIDEGVLDLAESNNKFVELTQCAR